MNTGVTYIEINYDANWVNNALANLSGFSWLYQWGMYLFLIITLAILFWIFFDSITKKKDQKALIPRILAIVGFFCIIPAFIFRFTGNADGVTTLVRLGAETGTPFFCYQTDQFRFGGQCPPTLPFSVRRRFARRSP